MGSKPGRDFEPPYTIDFLGGTWVGSSSGFVHNSPTEMGATSDRPPELAAFYSDGSEYVETQGYTLAATLMCLRLDGIGGLVGKITHNRGGQKIVINHEVTGTYLPNWNSALNVVEGNFTTYYRATDQPTITIHYYFVATDLNQLDWIRLKSSKGDDNLSAPFRGTVAHGTLRRVPYGQMSISHPSGGVFDPT